ncbi:MAG: single-stranded DNA-binding protein [Bacteroidales bacterium]|nr:single-stranded DNA-binding protein [Bacteroidales bacterium]
MEFLNRIELRGVVGRADVNSYNGSLVCNFSVVTENSAVDKEGNSTVESTWFNVTAWEGQPGIPDLYSIQKGGWIRVVGRLRQRKYVTQDGEERMSLDVLARLVELIPREDLSSLSPQRDW